MNSLLFLYGFCFSLDVELATVEKTLAPLILPKDQFRKIEQTNCVEMEVSPSRKEMIADYLSQRYKILRSYGDDPNSKVSQPCPLQFEQRGQENSQNLMVGNKTLEENKKSKSLTTMQLSATSNAPASIKMGQEELSVLCQKQGQDNYRLTISLFRQNGGLSTDIDVAKGQWVDLGSTTEQLQSKEREIILAKGLQWQKKDYQQEFQYRLRIQP